MNSGVTVFRKRLLAYSETFIAQQGINLPRYRTLFCGYTRDHSGCHLLGDSSILLLEDCTRFPQWGKLTHRMGLSANKRWINHLQAFQADVIHAHFFSDGFDAARISGNLDVPLITTLHGHDITKHHNVRAQNSHTRKFFEQVDCVIAVSDFIAREALKRGFPEQKLVQHYIGIDIKHFDRPKNEVNTPSLLFVGRLTEKKGVTYLLQAMERLQPAFPDLKLTIVGTGHLQQSLQKEAYERKLNVEFAGAKPPKDVRDLLAGAWLFVAPSIISATGDAEGLGMVFLEAQAMRTPVVSFRSGGIAEAVDDGVTGLLAPKRDVAALADNIALLLRDENLRREMGARGRRRVEEHFDITTQCAKLEQIYNSVCR